MGSRINKNQSELFVMDGTDGPWHNNRNNPLISRFRISKIQKLKMVIFGIFLLPLRAAAMLTLILIGSLVGIVCNIGVAVAQEPEPHTGYRKFGQKLLSKLGRVLVFIMGYHHIETKGKLASSEEAPVIVVAPHFSFMDGPLSVSIGHLTYMSRLENDHAPLFGPMVRLLQPIYVKRGERSSREETIKEILRRSRSKGVWPNICVFPEGTCTNGESLITFKPGAFHAGVPVQPVLFKYPKDMIAWTWISPSTLKQMAYILSQLNNSVEVEFLPVYKPNEEEQQNAILYANNVRKVMARALGVPTSDHSFEDSCLMMEASAKKLPMEAAIVEYHKVNRELGLNLDKLKELLKRFSIIDKNKDGLITFDEFSQHLSDIDTEKTRLIFNRIDQDRRGFIDFQKFIYGVSKGDFPEEAE